MLLDDTCPNCDRILHGQFCSFCGQNQKGTDRYFWTLVNEAFEGLFSLQSKSWRTTFYLFFKPGFLTQEYFSNRRARYITPLRLYLITSISFFLLLSMVAFFSNAKFLGGNVDLQTKESSAPQLKELAVDVPTRDTNLAEIQESIRVEQEPATAKTLRQLYEESPSKVELSLPLVSPEREKQLSALLEKKIADAVGIATDRPKLLIGKLIDSSPPVVMLLLPIFALVLKLCYLKSGRYYSQHLVLAVHNHSFFFGIMVLITVLAMLMSEPYESWFTNVAWIWIWLYMLFTLKRVFQQSWKLTVFKSVLLTSVYTILFAAGVACITILGIVLL